MEVSPSQKGHQQVEAPIEFAKESEWAAVEDDKVRACGACWQFVPVDFDGGVSKLLGAV